MLNNGPIFTISNSTETQEVDLTESAVRFQLSSRAKRVILCYHEAFSYSILVYWLETRHSNLMLWIGNKQNEKWLASGSKQSCLVQSHSKASKTTHHHGEIVGHMQLISSSYQLRLYWHCAYLERKKKKTSIKNPHL